MKTLRRPLALAVVALAAALPALAESFVVTLRNGSTIETRYRPRIEPDDPQTVLLLTELGNRIALARTDILEIRSAESRPTLQRILAGQPVALGPAPNDAPAPLEVMGGDGPLDLERILDYLARRQLAELERRLKMVQANTVRQFDEPPQAGGDAPGGLRFWPPAVTTLDPTLLRLQGLPAGREIETYWALQGLTPESAARLQGQGTVAGAPPALFQPATGQSPSDPDG